MRDILNQIAQIAKQGHSAVLCTLVETRGSTPQKAGASMLVLPDGSQTGTLGGGCVEAEVKRKALAIIGSDHSEILSFNLDDNYGWDDGLICGGRMQILAEPISSSSYDDYFRTLHDMITEGEGCIEAISIAALSPDFPPGARLLIDQTAIPRNGLRCDMTAAQSLNELPHLDNRPRPSCSKGVAYLPILPQPMLLIIGAGHVGQAVAALASQAGFLIHVMDDRDQYANHDRFPTARHITVAEIEQGCENIATDIHTHCIIVTRGHAHDEQALFHMIKKTTGYLGMIGSKRKIKLIYEDLVADGIPQAELARVHAPLGLDIGSQTVPEIAISIVAELIAFRNLGHSPEYLKRKSSLVAT